MLTPLSYFIAVTGVAECIAVALEDNEVNGTLGRPGRVCGVPGPEIPWDGCDPGCGGQLAVAIQHGPFPSIRFPTEVIEDATAGGCYLAATAIRCIASLTRCQYHPQGNLDKGVYPTPTTQTNAMRLQQTEGYYMRQAIQCCLDDMKRTRLIDDYRLASNDTAVNGACGEVSVVFYINVV
jgi:hypothetical protein